MIIVHEPFGKRAGVDCILLLSSLLSHSAVVARELGLPTIVGVSGGLMKRLRTGMKVHVDAGKGRITIIRDESES